MNRAYLIDSTYLKTEYPGYVEANVDDNAIASFIIIAQDKYLQSVLGFTMYNYIITTFISDPSGETFSDQYQYILVNNIYPSVAMWSMYEMYPTLLYKATNKAVVTKNSDESEPVGIRQLEYVRNQIRNTAEYYDSRIREYITNNVNDFQEYFSTSGVNRIRPKSNLYYGGIYLKPQPRSGLNSSGGCCNDSGIQLNF